MVLDVRPLAEYQAGHIPNAVPIDPLRLHDQLRKVPREGPAYGDEHSYNGLRLAGALAKHDQLTAPPTAPPSKISRTGCCGPTRS